MFQFIFWNKSACSVFNVFQMYGSRHRMRPLLQDVSKGCARELPVHGRGTRVRSLWHRHHPGDLGPPIGGGGRKDIPASLWPFETMYFNQSIGATAFYLAMWPVADFLFLCFVFNYHHLVSESTTSFQTPSGKAVSFLLSFFFGPLLFFEAFTSLPQSS